MTTLKKEVLVDIFQGQTEGQTKVGAVREIKEIDELIVAIANRLQVDEKIKVGEYFTIAKLHKEACIKKNPKTGEDVPVEAKDVIVIKATKAGKELV